MKTLLLFLVFINFSFAQSPAEDQLKSVSRELDRLTSKDNLTSSEVQRSFQLQNMKSELEFRVMYAKTQKDNRKAKSDKLPLTVEATISHPNYKLLNNLQDILETPVRKKNQAERLNQVAMSVAGTCVDMGCFCGQKNIPPACFDDPYRCCEGEAPKQQTELEKLSGYFENCNKYDGAISCDDGTYIKKSDDPNTIFQLMDHVNQGSQVKERQPSQVDDSGTVKGSRTIPK